jgi:hypothetical protein
MGIKKRAFFSLPDGQFGYYFSQIGVFIEINQKSYQDQLVLIKPGVCFKIL